MQNSPATLLIVDDEPSIRETLAHVLTEIGYCVRLAADGFSALREMRLQVPDLLLSDLNMPNMSGFELLSVVRRRFPAIRTIAMSGSFSGDEVPSGVAADGFFPKGSSIFALLRIIASLPHIERRAPQPSSPHAPLWVHHDPSALPPDGCFTITCPECLRSFPQAIGAGYPEYKADCIYCDASIHHQFAQPANQMPLEAFQRATATAMPLTLRAPSLNY